MKTVITTWLSGSHKNGTLSLSYIFALVNERGEVWGSGTYSTPEGARRAARRRGLAPTKGVYQGHRSALIALTGSAPTEREMCGVA